MTAWTEGRQFCLVFQDGSRMPCDNEEAAIQWCDSFAPERNVRIESRQVEYGPWEAW